MRSTTHTSIADLNGTCRSEQLLGCLPIYEPRHKHISSLIKSVKISKYHAKNVCIAVRPHLESAKSLFPKCETQVIPVANWMLWGDNTAFILKLGFIVLGTLSKLPGLMDISDCNISFSVSHLTNNCFPILHGCYENHSLSFIRSTEIRDVLSTGFQHAVKNTTREQI